MKDFLIEFEDFIGKTKSVLFLRRKSFLLKSGIISTSAESRKRKTSQNRVRMRLGRRKFVRGSIKN